MSFLYDPLTTFLTGLDFMGVALIILRVLVAIVLIYVLFPGVRTYSARSGCGLAPKICTVYLLLFWGFRILQPFITSLAVQCLSLLDAYQACALPAVFALGLCLQFPRLDSLAAARVSLRFAEAASIWDWLFDILLVSTCWLWIASRKSGILARRLLISACRRLLGPALLKVALWLLAPSLELLAPVLDPLSAHLAKWNPLSAQVAEQASIISTLEARLADLQQQLQQRNVAVADADITIADLIETMNATSAQLTEKQEMITFTHAATIDLERNLTIHEEQMAAVMESLRLLETESAAEAASNRETIQQKEESERRVESLSEALRDAREQLRVAQLNGTPPTVQVEDQETEEAKAALQAIIVRLEAEQAKKDDETRALQDQLNAAQAKLLKVEAHILDNELSEAESKATLLTMEVQHDLKLQNMARDLQDVQGQLEIAQRRASAFERQSIDKQVKEQELQAEVRRLETVDADHRLNILRREHAHRSELESILEIVTKQDVHIKRWQAQYASQEAALAHKERLIASRDDEIVTLSASNSVASDCHALSHKDASSATTAATPSPHLVDAAIQTADVPTSESALSFSLSFSLELPHLDAKRSKWFMQDEREVVDFDQAMASSLSSALSWSGAFNSSPPRSLEGLNLVAEGMVPASSSTSPNTDDQLELASKPAKQLTYDDFFSPEREGHSTLRPTANADADDLTPVRSSPCSLLDLDLVAEGMVPANGRSSSSTDGQLELASKSANQPTSEDIFSPEREGHSTLRPTANADLDDLTPLRPSLPSDDMSFEIADKLRDMSCDLLHDDFSFLAKGQDDSFWMKDDEGVAEGLARVADTTSAARPHDAPAILARAALPSDTSFEIADKLCDVSCDLLHDEISFLATGQDDSFWMKDDEEDAAEALPVVADTTPANADNASEVVLAEEPVNDPATEHTADIAIYPAPQLTILTDAPVQTPSASSESEDALRPKDGDARMNLTGVVLPSPIDSAGVPADAAIQPPPSSSFEVCDKLESVSCDLLHDRISFLSQDNDSFWLKDDEVLDTDATPAECAISLSPDDSFGEKDMSLECIAPGALFSVHDSDGEQDMSMELIEHDALFFSSDLFWAAQGDAGPTPASPSTLQFDLIAEKTEESPVCRIRAPLNDPRVLVPSAADTAEPVAGSSFSSRSSPLAEVASRSCEFEVGRTTEDISKGAPQVRLPTSAPPTPVKHAWTGSRAARHRSTPKPRSFIDLTSPEAFPWEGAGGTPSAAPSSTAPASSLAPTPTSPKRRKWKRTRRNGTTPPRRPLASLPVN